MFIPIDKIKQLREAARNGDVRAKKILTMQMNGEDFGSSLDEYFAQPEQPVQKQEVQTNLDAYKDIQDEKLRKFLAYNNVKPGDQDYDSTVEAYYQEFPKARPGHAEMKATNTDVEVNLPNDDDNVSIYGEEDEEITDFNSPSTKYVSNSAQEEKLDIFDKLIEDEIEAIRAYNDAIVEIMKSDDYGDNEKKGIIAKLSEIKNDEAEHYEELKRLKENTIKKEESAIE